MDVHVKKVTRRGELKKFIYLPAKIHRDHAKWVPPIYAGEWRFFNRRKNRAFSYCDTTLALAYRGTRLAGRIMGIINKRSNDLRGERNGRFGCLECFDDEKVAHRLLDYAEEWARKKGMNKLVGPLGFTEQDPEGFLVEGFEYEPTIATYYNFEYILRFLESKGYAKEVDYVVYKVRLFNEIPDFYQRISNRVLTRGKFALAEFTKRKELKPYILPILGLMNETFDDLYGYTALDEAEMVSLAKQYLPVIDPRFVKVIIKDEQVIAFVLGIPNMSEGIRRAKGRLFPFGIIKILRAAKKAKQLDLLLGGIKQEYRGKGLDAVMGTAMMRSAKNAGFTHVDSHHEMETNVKVRAEMERLGGELYKRYRVFQKKL
jgi:GNAT superfamily N-acetyltransferase